nr:MAG TPA: hypothetical protein [Caudoviricetes sp.]
MAFEDIKLRGLTFAERSELIKAELDPLYTPLPEETPESAKLLWYRNLAEWIMKNVYKMSDSEIAEAPNDGVMELAIETMRFTHEKKAEIEKN